MLLIDGGQAILAGVWVVCDINLIYPTRAQGSEQNGNVSVANVVGETWAVIDAEHDTSENGWETYESETNENWMD